VAPAAKAAKIVSTELSKLIEAHWSTRSPGVKP
jgi:hypothetical protein